MSDIKKICDLCSLEVEVSGFKLNTKDGEKQFCCEGCMGIYEMLNEDQILDEANRSDMSQ